jgi:uncharacterized membrane protein
MHDALLLAAPFLACVVEMVEAFTIVLALGLTRGWRAVLAGAVGAVVVLGLVVAVLGSHVSSLPLTPLRLCVGAFLLVFGMLWLQKAIRRAGGLKALHDENKIFVATTRTAESVKRSDVGIDWYGLVTSFKGVLLEGIEVVFIVVTVGSAQHDVGLTSLGAVVAFGVVALVGIAIHKPLARVPENTLKLAVAILLTSFGIVWILEGAGIASSGSTAFLGGVLAVVSIVSAVLVELARRRSTQPRRLAVAGRGH